MSDACGREPAAPSDACGRESAGLRDRPGAVGWIGLLVLCAAAVLAAGVEALLVPLYAGTTPVPVAVVLALATNAIFPPLGYRLVPRLLGPVAPFVCWIVAIFWFGVVARPEGDVIMPGGSLQWMSYGVMLGGALAGTLAVVFALPPRSRRVEPRVSAGTDPGSPRPAPPGRR
jgi:hypothetical protein